MSKKTRKRRRNLRGVYTITKKQVGGAFPYETYKLRGVTLHGREIRQQSRDPTKMEKVKAGLEVADGAAPDEHNILTHLTLRQVRAAEAAYNRIGARSLHEVVAFFEQNFEEPKTSKTLTETMRIYVDEQKANPKRSPAHIETMEYDLERLCAGARGKLCPHEFMHHPHATSFMKSLTFVSKKKENGEETANEKPKPRKVGPKRWNNVRGSCHAFFEWMREKKNWCAKNPFTKVKIEEIDRKPIEVLKVQQAAALMKGAMEYEEGRMVPYFALLLFAGIRPAQKRGEIEKLATHPDLRKKINFAVSYIDITSDIAKRRYVRKIKIQPALEAWLLRYPVEPGPVLSRRKKGSPAEPPDDSDVPGLPPSVYRILPRGSHRMIGHLRDAYDLEYDMLRHSFISYHVAKFDSVGKAALEAGNSEAIIMKHYLNIATKAEADLFWSITPELLTSRFQYKEFMAKADAIEYKKLHGVEKPKEVNYAELTEGEEGMLKAEAEEPAHQRAERENRAEGGI